MNSPLPAQLPFSACTPAGGFLFLSGMLGHRPQSMELVGEDVGLQAQQAIDHIEVILAQYGADLSHVVKATIYLIDLKDWERLNQVWCERFSPPYPSRTAVEVRALKLGGRVEIDVIAIDPRR